MNELADQRAALDAALAGGVVGYVQRMRDGWSTHVPHRPTFAKGRDGQIVYRGCACGELMCNAPIWLAHIDDLIAAYEAKVADFAAETQRSSLLMRVVDRLMYHVNSHREVNSALRDGYAPPDELEVLRATAERMWPSTGEADA